MELICQDFTTSKSLKGIFRSLCLFLALLPLICILSGCSISQTEDEEDRDKSSKTEQEEQSKGTALGEEGKKDKEDKEDKEDKPITMAQLLEDAGNGIEKLPDTVLWFNATYAPLTYNNGGEWRIVSGEEITEDYQRLVKISLQRSWNIKNRESALETVENLQKSGHRKIYRECLEKLKEEKMLNLGGEEFVKALENSDIKENLFRYVLVYSFYHEGWNEDAIAAWDLCRINQLYADFYVCGYMSYEEAMDASLKNSIELQKMYDSWEELVDSYMLGYQFWQSDPCLTEDSPTLQRYQCYEMLNKMEDGPYSLDWDMELKKSW